MPKLPRNPPTIARLRELGPSVFRLSPEDGPILRIYAGGGDYPSEWNAFRYFGPVNSRFDHHPLPTQQHPDRGILYGALSLTTCLAEYFQHERTISTRNAPRLAAFDLAEEVSLLDLTGAWPTRIGGSMKINSGPRDIARAWSRQFYQAFPEIDGLYYASSMHANAPAIAFYEPAKPAFPPEPLVDRPLDTPAFLHDIKRSANEIGYDMVPTF